MAGDVAGGARVGVVPPGAAEAAGPLEDDEVLDARPPQRDGGADAGEAAADDGHAGGCGQRAGRGGVPGHGVSCAS